MGAYYGGIIKTLLYPHDTYEPPTSACLARIYNIILIYSVLTLWVLTCFQDHNCM